MYDLKMAVLRYAIGHSVAVANLPMHAFSSHSFLPLTYIPTQLPLHKFFTRFVTVTCRVIKLNFVLDSKILFEWGAANQDFILVKWL
jgi:hypothetical protein